MLTLYRPGTGILYRVPAGPKLAGMIVVVLAVSLLPSTLPAASLAAGVCVLLYGAGLGSPLGGLRDLARQTWALKWVVVLIAAGQLVFLGVIPAVANTTRVIAAVLLAGLVTLTTRFAALLDAAERGLHPLAWIGLDPARAALVVAVTASTLPTMARIARDVRDAQKARGARPGLRVFAVPFLVMALKHADELGDALAARGVR